MNCPHCDRPAQRSGLCAAHAWRQRNGRPMEGPIATRKPRGYGTRCAIPGCARIGACWLDGERICVSHETRKRRGMADWRERPMPPIRGRSKHQKKGEVVAINVRLPVPLAARLDKLAELRGITRGTAAREAIEAWLAAARPDGRVAAGEIHDSAAWARRASEWEEA